MVPFNKEDRLMAVTVQLNLFKGPSIQVIWKLLLTGGCLLLNE